MKKLSIAYFGSPDFSASFLEKLITDVSINQPARRSLDEGGLIEVKLVVTQSDQPVGRKQILTPTPVKIVAEKYKIKSKILNHKSQINNKSQIKNPKRLEFGISNLFGACNLEFSALKNIDLALVYAFGEIIPKEILDLPKYGFWNIHPSLLPKYRGSSPIASPIIAGDKTTGVTIIKMDEKVDHGPIIAQQSLTIKKTDKRPDLEKKLTNLAFEMFKKTVFNKDSLQLKPQNHTLATYTKKLTKEDGFIKLKTLKKALEGIGAEKIYNLFRGLYPWPGLWTMIKPIQPTRLDEAKRLKITDLELVNGKLIIKKVQLEGKKEVDFATFNKAYKNF